MIEHWQAADPIKDVWTSDPEKIVEAIGPFYPGDLVLDLGCGPGRILGYLRQVYPTAQFVGLDIARRMVGDCPGVVFGDGYTIPISQVNMGYSVNLFQHLNPINVQSYLGEIKRVVRGSFRFQFVTRGEAGPFSYPVAITEMRRMVGDAGLTVLAVDDGLVEDEWCWMTVA